MKKTVNINLNGTVFYIDDDAFEVLNAYLNKLEQHFKNNEEGKEIITDIESRIAELFSEKISNKNGVVNIEMVNDVMDKMGDPSQFDDDEEPETKSTSVIFTKRKKRLYRDSENKVLGGVCSGIAAYLNTDPVLIRIIFAILPFLSLGIIVPIYIILWIIVPEAVTTAQKLEMRGENVTISNIEKTIKKEYDDVKERFSKVKETQTFRKSESWWNRLTKRDKNFMIVGIVIIGLSVFGGLFHAIPAFVPMFHNVDYHFQFMPMFQFPGIVILAFFLLLAGIFFKSIFKVLIYIIAFMFLIGLVVKVLGFFIGSLAVFC